LSTSQDGLYDIFLGTLIILLSTMPWLDEVGRLGTLWNVVLVEAVAFLILGGILLTKKLLVAPRIGQVRYGAPRKKRLRRLAMGMGVTFLVTVGLLGMTILANRRGPISNSPIGWDFELDIVHTGAGVFMLGLFSVIGYVNDYPRMYLYGAIFGFGYVVSTYLQDQIGITFYWPWAAAGALAVLIGVLTFTRFLKEFPNPIEPAVNGAQ
jgi:hypothetical protein